ncbi:hypothetical protein [Sandaracinus amylolyticus]|uniref:Peptidase S9 prolyl oligopeptidase catalytic domain-containing protein n=1 Tax=Sandaracinus amylolyticus TaxID=927083 RepID=A0A0F6SF40_9BACT|nr:hypothetical protein [Sandaracinus amylolyticus]AKF06279.1 hypothetical protein DB32_003428 [Sandaracinus amylolyticus]
MRFSAWSWVALLSALLLVACGDDDDGSVDPDAGTPDAGPSYPAECENVSPMDCLLPWPSSRYLAEDETTATGVRIEIPEAAMPLNSRAVPVDPTILSRFDGFSPATSIITAFDDVDPSNLPDEEHIQDSLAQGSPTVLIDAETGERVAHFAEIDTWDYIDPARRPLYIRPAARLAQQRRYLVAIRDLRHTDGSAIEPSAYFRALRDETPLPDASDIESRRAHFEDVFTRLETAGVERATLIEAWDFQTGTDELAWHDTISVRDQGLRAMATDTAAPRCTVTETRDAPRAEIWREIEGTVRVPLFLGGTDPDSHEESVLSRDGDGEPAQNGWADVPFIIRIPNSVRARVAAGGEPVRLLDYGHGLFGDRYGDGGTVSRTIEANEMVSVQIDWWGWSRLDVTRVAQTLQNFSLFTSFGERAVQGVVNHVFLHRAFSVEGGCAELAELQIPLDAGGTAPAIDREELYYYGNSQGGIFGLSLAGIAVDVDRFVVGVGGMTYSIMIPRSSNWVTYGSIMELGYRDPLQRSMLMVMAQSLFDLAEPATYAPHVLSDPLPCADDVCASGATPLKHVLSQIGRDDAQVPNVAAHIAARTMGIGYASPAPYEPWNMEALTADMGASLGTDAMVVFDIPEVPVLPLGTRNPGGDNPAHSGVRESPAAVEQIDLFLRPDGTVVQTCDGVCDPT